MSSVATGTKVLLFAFLEFNSFDECNVALEYLKPYAHQEIIAECEWHNHSDIFFFTHAERHAFFAKEPLQRPQIIVDLSNNKENNNDK